MSRFFDCVREVKPPFSLESLVAEYAALLKTYRIGSVRGDRYAGEWPREQFRKYGIDYLPSDKSKSELYGALLPLLSVQWALGGIDAPLRVSAVQ